jgi:hypothetical protein
MTTPIGKIDELIGACQKRLEDAQQKLQKAELRLTEAREVARDIEAELRGLNSARDTLSGVPSTRQRVPPPRPRRVSNAWKTVLQFIGSKGELGASIDEIYEFSNSSSLEMQPGAIRSQLSNYKQSGALDTVGDAQYRLTPQGDALLKQSDAHE